MVLKLTLHIRYVLSFSYKPINQFFPRESFNFGLYFTDNRLFWARPWLWRHCDVILGILVLIWNVWTEETPCHSMVPIKCIWVFHFHVQRRWKQSPWEDVLQKGLERRLLILTLILTLSYPYPHPFSTPDFDPDPTVTLTPTSILNLT